MAHDARGLPAAVAPSQELAALLAITRVLTSSLDYHAIAAAVLEGAETLIGECAGFLWELRGEDFHAVALRGFRPDGRPLPRFRVGQGLTGLAAARREPAISADLRDDPRVTYRDWLAAQGLVSAIVLPLLHAGTLLGTLNLFTRTRHDFAPEEVRLLEAFAAQAAAAIGNARLYAQSERRRRAAEAVAAVGRLVAESLDPAEVARRVAERVMTLLGATATVLYRVEAGSGDLVALATAGDHGPLFGKPLVLPRGTGISGMAVQLGRPVTSPDLLSDERLQQAPVIRERIAQAPFRTALSVPLVVRDRVIGALAAADVLGRVFDEEDIRLVQTLADQAALALENARLFTETTSRRRLADELARVARTVTESLDVGTVGARVVATVRALLGVESSTVRLLEPDGVLVLVAHAGPTPYLGIGHRQPPGMGVSGRAVAEGRPVRTRDLLHDPNVALTDELRAHFAAQGYRAMVAVPLRAKGRIIGTLSVCSTADREFAADELALLDAFADQVALALENARLYAEASRRRQEAEHLARSARALTESLDVATISARTVEIIRELLGAEVAGLRLLQPDGGLISMDQCGPLGPHFPRGQLLPPGTGVAGRAVATGRPAWSADVQNDPTLQVPDPVRALYAEAGVHAVLVAPLVARGQTIGTLAVGHAVVRQFSADEVALLQAFADQVALALDNARLFGEAEARRASAEALAEVGRGLTRTLDVEEVARRVTEGVRRLLRGLNAAVYHLDPASGDLVVVGSAGDMGPGFALRSARPSGTGMSGLAVLERRPVVTRDLLADPRVVHTPEDRARVRKAPYRAVLSLPLLVQERVIGALSVADGAGRTFSDEDVRLAQAFADQVALALENAHLYARAQAARAEAEESGRRFHDLVQGLDAIVWECDAETWQFTFVSQPAESLLGYPIARWLAEPDFGIRLIHPEDRERVVALGRAAVAERWDKEYEYRTIAADGRTVWLHETVYVVAEPDGRPRRLRGLTIDITARRHAEAALREGEQTRRVLLGRVIAAQEDERGRIARELHDETAQSLASLVIGLSALQQERRPRTVRSRLMELHALASAALGEVRRLAHGLRPSVLNLLGLVPALERHAEEFGRLHRVAVSVRADALGAGRLPPAAETALYRIVQEALANVARHAGARAVTIVLARDRRGVSLTVTDDGRGFDVHAARAGPDDVMHLGLENMRERAAALNGELTVESAPGRGTTVRATVPLAEEPDGQDQDPPRG